MFVLCIYNKRFCIVRVPCTSKGAALIIHDSQQRGLFFLSALQTQRLCTKVSGNSHDNDLRNRLHSITVSANQFLSLLIWGNRNKKRHKRRSEANCIMFIWTGDRREAVRC